ncbi:antibiotic biosynthesis monooxygenase [Salinispirillum sp. LH 10-3-1]|uniref:Antibiotic biosynthesis monooxygenase n=1 Tax=Salinispirillum sp. LH 10-3-1 TaxID=2952525 RepID=A0AB38YJX8_9GAMM
MPKIILEGHIVVSDADLAAVMAELPAHIQLTRLEEGCLHFEVTQSPGAENVFFVSEEFIDRASFEAHQSHVKSSEWGRVASNVERHYQVTEVG